MRFATETDRVEAFSDGVFAVLITIMVLELHPPGGFALRDIVPVLPNIAIYALSFVLVAIYWNNHHHMLRASVGIDRTDGAVRVHLVDERHRIGNSPSQFTTSERRRFTVWFFPDKRLEPLINANEESK